MIRKKINKNKKIRKDKKKKEEKKPDGTFHYPSHFISWEMRDRLAGY